MRPLASMFLSLPLLGACGLAPSRGPMVYETCSADPAVWTLRDAPPPDAVRLLADAGSPAGRAPDARRRQYWFDRADGALMHCDGAFLRGKPETCGSITTVYRRGEPPILGTLTQCG